LPYGGAPVRPGDVIYFQAQGGSHAVVHRVMAVTPEGLRTRGDNNPADDVELLPLGEVKGRVVAARDGRGMRTIAGGWRGQLVRCRAAAGTSMTNAAARTLHRAYHGLARSGVVQRLCPGRLRPRVYAFRARKRAILRLMLDRREVGRYLDWQQKWQIRRPYRLLVDAEMLERVVAELGEQGGKGLAGHTSGANRKA
jgi:hypothetical protein